MTRKELRQFVDSCSNYKKGYCCYRKDGLAKVDLQEIGSNSGIYGWNWTCYYYPPTDTAYVDSYRHTGL